ncbi:MAG: hypothetical protein H7Z75_10000 [Ferruginibacter sp.]|nr:hypothetical protein [Cytophagales bacterium]
MTEGENYLRMYPGLEKWINQCVICQTKGYKPEIPEKIFPGIAAQNIKKFFPPLELNGGICEECLKHLPTEIGRLK